MKQYTDEILLDTTNRLELFDITEDVQKVLEKSGINEGILTVFCNHTTAGVKINERCQNLVHDIKDFLDRAVPEADYLHNTDTVDGRPNARSHLMSFFTNASETVPVASGELMLGTWQSIFFTELDGPRSGRKVVVKVMGN